MMIYCCVADAGVEALTGLVWVWDGTFVHHNSAAVNTCLLLIEIEMLRDVCQVAMYTPSNND